MNGHMHISMRLYDFFGMNMKLKYPNKHYLESLDPKNSMCEGKHVVTPNFPLFYYAVAYIS